MSTQQLTNDVEAMANMEALSKLLRPRFKFVAYLAVLSLIVSAPATHVWSQEQTDKERAEATLKLANEKAAELELRLADDRRTKLTLHPSSLLRWSNPVTTALYGEVFLWTAKGRPQAIASMHKFFQPERRHMTGEFHSLALEPINGLQQQRPFWNTKDAGIAFKKLANAPAVAPVAPQRLAQMRRLARQFSAEASARDEVDNRERLRLLPKQIYRYDSTSSALLDGAIFTFVQGTNPEVLLLLEARRVGDEHTWQYALVRFNSVAMRAYHGDQLVWSVPQVAPPWQDVRDPNKVYFVPKLDDGE